MKNARWKIKLYYTGLKYVFRPCFCPSIQRLKSPRNALPRAPIQSYKRQTPNSETNNKQNYVFPLQFTSRSPRNDIATNAILIFTYRGTCSQGSMFPSNSRENYHMHNGNWQWRVAGVRHRPLTLKNLSQWGVLPSTGAGSVDLEQHWHPVAASLVTLVIGLSSWLFGASESCAVWVLPEQQPPDLFGEERLSSDFMMNKSEIYCM